MNIFPRGDPLFGIALAGHYYCTWLTIDQALSKELPQVQSNLKGKIGFHDLTAHHFPFLTDLSDRLCEAL